MKEYVDLVEYLLCNGSTRWNKRTNSSILSCFNPPPFRFYNGGGFPLLTSKKMSIKTILVELEWFLCGENRLDYLVKNGCNIWNRDAYRFYQEEISDTLDIPLEDVTYEFFLDNYSYLSERFEGFPLGPIYGYQWRKSSGIDQLSNLVKGLISDPFGRRHILNSWNVQELKDMCLPPCHIMIQCYVRDDKQNGLTLDLMWYQRSADLA